MEPFGLVEDAAEGLSAREPVSSSFMAPVLLEKVADGSKCEAKFWKLVQLICSCTELECCLCLT